MQVDLDMLKCLIHYILKPCFSKACGIELVDTLVVTGGDGEAGNRVQVYNTMGPVERLPNMTIAREWHACSHYIDSNDNIVSVNMISLLCLWLTLDVRFIW